MAKLPAGTRKRNDGKFEMRITINGKRYSIYANNIKDLQAKVEEKRAAILAGEYKNNKNITVKAYYDEWIEYKKQHVKGATAANYITALKPFLKSMGHYKLKDIETRQIKAFLQERAKGKSKYNANYTKTVLKNFFKSALCDEIISRNPVENIESYKCENKAINTIHRALTLEEQKKFMQAAKNSFYYELFMLLICSGMRIGECTALKWADIDTKNNLIHISRTITRNAENKRIMGENAKSKAGTRDIEMNAGIKTAIKAQRTKCGNIAPITDTVFVTPYGKTISTATINIEIRNICNACNIDKFTSHAFRDTFATRYIEQGGNPKTLQAILGHENIDITMNLYTHVMESTKKEEMQRINIVNW